MQYCIKILTHKDQANNRLPRYGVDGVDGLYEPMKGDDKILCQRRFYEKVAYINW